MHGRHRGFTLLELLVALVIIAVATAAVVVNLAWVGEDQDLEDDARRLATLLELAADEALLQGRDYGLHLTGTGYEFFVFDPQARLWARLEFDETLKPRDLTEGVDVYLFLDGREVTFDDDENLEALEPQIAILSSGELTPFELYLEREFDADEGFVITGQAHGRLELARQDEALTPLP